MFLKPTPQNGKSGRFNWSLFKETFQLTLKFHSFIPYNIPLYIKSQETSFELKLCSLVLVPSLFKKEINAFDSFGIECLIITILNCLLMSVMGVL